MRDDLKNKEGGVAPTNSKNMDAAKVADLITLPPDIKGTNCFNCKFVTGTKTGSGIGFCNHPDVNQPVTERMCCALWDNDKVKRPWKK